MSRGIVFIGLNAIRALSLLTLILVFASNILQIVRDIQAVNAFMANQGTTSAPTFDNSTDMNIGIASANADYIE
jgi:hypothetical protein